jgi:CubicO group peptidase (beta-lactamase class C family)
MKRLGVASFVLFFMSSAFAQSASTAVDKLLTEIGPATAPGVAVLVRQNGQTVLAAGHGVRDLRSRAPIDAQTNFRLASCTKQFTAMAIMLLVHDGKLKYDTVLTEIFPDFPAYGRAITIRHLLNHTSGLPDYEELMENGFAALGGPPRPWDEQSPSRPFKRPPFWTADNQITDAQVLMLLEHEDHGRFAPGTHWSYSNSGYVVLGLIVAKVSGKSFPDFLRERIFKPLHMDHTVAYVKGKNGISNRAYGHSVESGKLIETDQSSTSATLGDGGIYSSLDDLAKWDDALAQHTLLSQAEMQPALIPVKLADGSVPHWDSGPGDTDPLAGRDVYYGFGWFLNSLHGHERMWHYGDTIGFKSSIQRFPKDKLTVVVLSNRADVDAIALAEKIAAPYLPKQ